MNERGKETTKGGKKEEEERGKETNNHLGK